MAIKDTKICQSMKKKMAECWKKYYEYYEFYTMFVLVFFMSHLGLEISLGKLNQQWSQSIRGYKKFYVWSASIQKYKNFVFWKNVTIFFCFGLGVGKCTRVFLDKYKNFPKGGKNLWQ